MGFYFSYFCAGLPIMNNKLIFSNKAALDITLIAFVGLDEYEHQT